MKLRPTLLLWTAALFAAAPAWADRVPCCEFTRGSVIGISADVAHGFEASSTVHAWGSEHFTAKDTFFSLSSSREGKFDSDLSDLAFDDHFSSRTKPEKGLPIGNRAGFEGRGWDRNSHSDAPGPTQVPEPGSLSLLLLGLTAVGVFARRR